MFKIKVYEIQIKNKTFEKDLTNEKLQNIHLKYFIVAITKNNSSIEQ